MKRALILVVLMCLSSFAWSQNHQPAKLSASQSKKNGLTYDVILSSGKATVRKVKSGVYELRMILPPTNQVLLEPNRPNSSFYVPLRMLKGIWDLGKDSFKKVPPNAVLSAEKLRPTVVVLTSFSIGKNDTAIFTLSSKGPFKEGRLRKVVMTVDSKSCCEFACDISGDYAGSSCYSCCANGGTILTGCAV